MIQLADSFRENYRRTIYDQYIERANNYDKYIMYVDDTGIRNASSTLKLITLK